MEAATKTRRKTANEGDRELAVKLGTLMLHLLGGSGGDVFRVIEESGLSFAQVKVLVSLDLPEGDARTVTELSEDIGFSPASASRAAEGLVRKKLASRVEDADDRRVRRLTLTAKGRQLADRIISARLAGLEDFAASLNATERERLAAALDALLEREPMAEIYRTYERRAHT
jgi:DNA-binding MarR family transcriptional regulator